MTPRYRLRVSTYDRTASLIIALLVLVGLVVLGLIIVYFTMQLIERTVSVPVTVADSLGPPPDAAMGYARDIEPPGVEEAPELSEPSLPETMSTLSELARKSQAIFDENAIDSENEAGYGKGRGDSRVAGEGPAERVPRWERWRIRFSDVTSLTDYAAQLDFFGFELAVLGSDGVVKYAFDLSATPIQTRTGRPEEEQRIRFGWLDGALRARDAELLRRAGIFESGRPTVQFIPPEVEATLLRLESEFSKGRDVNDIRRTVFTVKRAGDGFEFQVLDQMYF